jgi:hypothetical protein
MNFTANAPNSVISPTGDYTFGLSDRGDQFWVRASTDTAPAGTFTFGTAVRGSDGVMVYTSRGTADSGVINPADGTITIKVAASKLNPFVTKGPAIANGSILAGLRGQAFTTGANAVRDLTRGGTQYRVGCGTAPTPTPTPSVTPTPTATPTPNPTPTVSPTPDPGGVVSKTTGGGNILNKVVNFGFKIDNLPSGHMNYQDDELDIHLISDSIDSYTYDAMTNEVTFTGRGRVGRDVVFFTVRVTDNGEPGTNDRFAITITGGRNSSRSGVLTQGNIQFHR